MVHSGDMAYDIDDNCTADVMWTEAHSLVSGGVVGDEFMVAIQPIVQTEARRSSSLWSREVVS